MNTSEKIRKRIQTKGDLELFSFDQIVKVEDSHSAAAKELSRMCCKGSIKRFIHGIYYKPKASRFGELKPSEENILKFLLFENGKRTGYISGDRLYNNLGLTSQVSGVITIATDQLERRPVKFSNVRIRYTKAYVRVDRENIYLLQLLDALKDISHILDSNVNDNLKLLYNKFLESPVNEQQELVRIAKNYPPRVRALLGSMLSKIWEDKPEYNSKLDLLKATIIDSSRFSYPINNTILKDPQVWNIYETTPA